MDKNTKENGGDPSDHLAGYDFEWYLGFRETMSGVYDDNKYEAFSNEWLEYVDGHDFALEWKNEVGICLL